MIVQLHAPAAVQTEKNPGVHWVWGCLGHRAGLDILRKRKISVLPGFRLQYCGSIIVIMIIISFVNGIYICIPETLHGTYVTLNLFCV